MKAKFGRFFCFAYFRWKRSLSEKWKQEGAWSLIASIPSYFIMGAWIGISAMNLEVRVTLSIVGGAIITQAVRYLWYLLISPVLILEEQDTIIAKYAPDKLVFNIEYAPYMVTMPDGQTYQRVALVITSNEKKKIIELEAVLNFECLEYDSQTHDIHYSKNDVSNVSLYWIEDNSNMNERIIALWPQHAMNLVIGVFVNRLQSGRGRDEVVLANEGERYSYTNESIFKIRVRIQGRPEGEGEFKVLEIASSIYIRPVDSRIMFLDDAKRTYTDIPKILLEK